MKRARTPSTRLRFYASRFSHCCLNVQVALSPDRDVAVHLLLKYFKEQTGGTFMYGGHESEGEADAVTLDSVIGSANLTFDSEQRSYVLAEADRRAFDTFVANEVRSRRARGERRANQAPDRRRMVQSSLAIEGARVDRVEVTTRTGRVASAVARR
jgi:hypothetical protein